MKGFAIPSLNLSSVVQSSPRGGTSIGNSTTGGGGTPRQNSTGTPTRMQFGRSPAGTPRNNTAVSATKSSSSSSLPPPAPLTTAILRSTKGPLIVGSPPSQFSSDTVSGFALLPVASLDGAFLYADVAAIDDVAELRKFVLDAREAVKALDAAYMKQLEAKQRIIEIRMRQLDDAMVVRAAVHSSNGTRIAAGPVESRTYSPGSGSAGGGGRISPRTPGGGTASMRPRPGSASSSRGSDPPPSISLLSPKSSAASPRNPSTGRLSGKSPSNQQRVPTRSVHPADTTTTSLRMSLAATRLASAGSSLSASALVGAPANPWSSIVHAESLGVATNPWVPPTRSPRQPATSAGVAALPVSAASQPASSTPRVYTVPRGASQQYSIPFRSAMSSPPVVAPRSPRNLGPSIAAVVFTKPYVPTKSASPR
jgi:hypothetical protein